DLKGHLVDDKFTIIDFGAPWCGPCHTAAETLSAYLRDHKDVAVRVVNLRADDVTLSYALPAAQQHLLYAPGLPWFLVYSPSGRVIHKSTSVEKVLAAIEKKRK
ncbi:MAG: thioredoxin domain-containing protein, partial [Myxococcota bacterium]|nr:thioredoxin domain-containing protein [Myxococcota bacterium]